MGILYIRLTSYLVLRRTGSQAKKTSPECEVVGLFVLAFFVKNVIN